MTDEEKEGYEELKKQYRLSTNVDCITTDIRNEYARTILNLIEKQQKEIETYKLLNANIEKDNKRQSIAIIEYQDLLENSISKDKIRDKIEELNKESKDLIKKGNFESRNDGFEATDIEGLNDLINYQSKGIIIKILKELLKEE